MVTILKHGAEKKTIQSVLKKLGKRKPSKVIDASKYCGKVNFKEDGLAIQRRMRDEW